MSMNVSRVEELEVCGLLIDEVIKHCARSSEVFSEAYGKLLPAHFTQAGEVYYRYIWATIIEHHEKYSKLPNYTELSTVVLSRLHGNEAIDDDVIKEADSLLTWMWGPLCPEDSLVPDAANEWLRVLLHDRVVTKPLMQEVRKADIGGGSHLPSMVRDIVAKLEQVDSVGIKVPDTCIPSDLNEEDGVITIPTGVSFIDSRMSGGMQPGEVNVLLGPTGVGKTTLGMQLAVEGARYSYLRSRDYEEPKKQNVFLSYEISLREMQIRMMTYAAQIDKSRLEQHKFKELSTRESLQDYERRRWKRQIMEGVEVPGEQDRWHSATPWLHDHMHLMDMSADQGDSNLGNGGIAEIKGTLDKINSQREHAGFNVIVIDWAGMVARQYLRAQGEAMDKLYYHELYEFVSRVRRQIANPYNCQVWVLHQLTGQANKKGPTARMHHSDAEGCGSFAVNAWFAFCLGNKDQSTNTCLLSATKTRRGAGQDAVVCKIDGAFGRLLDADKYYEACSLSGGIVSKQENSQLVDSPNNYSASRREMAAAAGSTDSEDEIRM